MPFAIKLIERRKDEAVRPAKHRKAENFMSSIQDVSAEQFAKLFHDYREALSHDGVDHGIKDESSSWERTPQNERKLMVAAARLALLELATAPAPRPGRKYYAKPGEAEWGC
jgi:hypothetical protein